MSLAGNKVRVAAVWFGVTDKAALEEQKLPSTTSVNTAGRRGVNCRYEGGVDTVADHGAKLRHLSLEPLMMVRVSRQKLAMKAIVTLLT